MKLEGKRVLVVGLGRSGVGAARLCAARGARVTVTDRKGATELAEAVRALDGCAALELGGHREEAFVSSDLVVLSPGVPEIPELRAARKAGVPVLGELELASRFVEAPILAVTGTNGKSTTTSLLGAMAAATMRPTFVGGNLGTPLAEAVGSAAAGSAGVLVLELSSFQLETVETFRARGAILLNLTEDHLDRYPTYRAYLEAKARLFERQTEEDFAVVNGDPDQADCVRIASTGRAKAALFCTDKAPDASAYLEGADLCVRPRQGAALERIPRSDLRLAGRHNVQNALAALLAARRFGVSLEECAGALRAFEGLPHRMQLVDEIAGVRFYNDSKATNVGSVVGSLSGFELRVVLIAGGKDKGGDYAPLVPILARVATHVVLIGAAADLLERALEGTVPLHRAGDLPSAVDLAAGLAQPGEAVVLSPACSSYDMFRDYEERGEVFARAVHALRGRNGGGQP
jgi:UDP-N-acetylmuramoylalanine--D-glutamate ligase